MPPTTLRSFRPDDIDAALALWRGCTGIGMGPSDTPAALRAFLQRNPECSFVAEAAGQLVGAVLGGHDGRRAFLYHLAVRSDCRSQGIGSRLVEAALARFTALGLTRVNLHLFADNDEGKAFWLSTRWRDRDDLIVLQQDLPASPSPTP